MENTVTKAEHYMNVIGDDLILGITLIVAVILFTAFWKLYVKAGEAGWKSLIPIYGNFVLCKIVFGNGWLCLLQFIPCLNFLFIFVLYFQLAKKYGKSSLFAIMTCLFPEICIPIIAFGKAEYQG